MHCFEGHRVLTLGELQNTKDYVKTEKPVHCGKHCTELLRFFCKTCNVPICKDCTMMDHSKGHEYDYLAEIGGHAVDNLCQLAEQANKQKLKPTTCEVRPRVWNTSQIVFRFSITRHRTKSMKHTISTDLCWKNGSKMFLRNWTVLTMRNSWQFLLWHSECNKPLRSYIKDASSLTRSTSMLVTRKS